MKTKASLVKRLAVLLGLLAVANMIPPVLAEPTCSQGDCVKQTAGTKSQKVAGKTSATESNTHPYFGKNMYLNARFAYYVMIPKTWRAKEESLNGDGARIIVKGAKHLEVGVAGFWAIEEVASAYCRAKDRTAERLALDSGWIAGFDKSETPKSINIDICACDWEICVTAWASGPRREFLQHQDELMDMLKSVNFGSSMFREN